MEKDRGKEKRDTRRENERERGRERERERERETERAEIMSCATKVASRKFNLVKLRMRFAYVTKFVLPASKAAEYNAIDEFICGG